MQTWAKRGLQTALVTGGLLMLGTGIASADEDVNPDKPASPLDGSVTVPVHLDNNVLGTPLGQKALPAMHKDVTLPGSDVTGALPVAKATPATEPLVAKATGAVAPVVAKAQSAVAPLPQEGRDVAAPFTEKATPVTGELASLPAGDKLPSLPSLDKVNVPAVDKMNGSPAQDNQINGDVVVPVDISGNAIAVLGKAETTNESEHGYGTYRDVEADGSGGFVGGNVVDLDWALPVQITNNAAAVMGKASAEGTTSQEAWATGNVVTDGTSSFLGGNVVAPQFATPVQVDGNAVAGGGSADAASEAHTSGKAGGSILTTGADSIGGGNAVPVPVAVPARANGNAIMALGSADAVTESTADATAGTTRPGKYNVPTYVETNGDPALAAGNVVQPAASGPAMLCGNAGGAAGSADASCDTATSTVAGGTSRSTGAGSAASGAIADAPVVLPVQGFGNAVVGLGKATADSDNVVESAAGGHSYTRGHDSIVSGTVAKAPLAGTGDVFANSVAVAGYAGSVAQNDVVVDSGGNAGTTGDDSLVGGNMAAAPVVAPAELFGNAAAGGGGAEATAAETKSTTSGSGRNTNDDYGVLASNLVTVPVATAAQAFGNGAGALAVTDAKATAVEEFSAGGNNGATGTAGLGSGNIGQVPVSMPFQVFGSGVSGLAKGSQTAVNQTDMEAGGDSLSDGAHGTGAGNVVTAPVAGAGQLYGESIAALGANRALAGSQTESEAGGDTETSGYDGLVAGNVVAPQALPLVQSFATAVSGAGGVNSALATNETEAESGGDIDTTGDEGVLSGNLLDVPAGAVVQPFGDAVAAVASRSYAAGLNDTQGEVGGTSTTSGDVDSLSGIDGTLPIGANVPVYDIPVEVLAKAMTESANNSALQAGDSEAQLYLPVTGGLSPTELPSFASQRSQRSMPADGFGGAFTGVLTGVADGAPGLPGLPGQNQVGGVTDVAGNSRLPQVLPAARAGDPVGDLVGGLLPTANVGVHGVPGVEQLGDVTDMAGNSGLPQTPQVLPAPAARAGDPVGELIGGLLPKANVGMSGVPGVDQLGGVTDMAGNGGLPQVLPAPARAGDPVSDLLGGLLPTGGLGGLTDLGSLGGLTGGLPVQRDLPRTPELPLAAPQQLGGVADLTGNGGLPQVPQVLPAARAGDPVSDLLGGLLPTGGLGGLTDLGSLGGLTGGLPVQRDVPQTPEVPQAPKLSLSGQDHVGDVADLAANSGLPQAPQVLPAPAARAGDPVGDLLGGLLPTGGLGGLTDLGSLGGLTGGLPVQRDVPQTPEVPLSSETMATLPGISLSDFGGLGGFDGLGRSAVPVDPTAVTTIIPVVPASGDLIDITTVLPVIPAAPGLGGVGTAPLVQAPAVGTLPVPGAAEGVTPELGGSSLDSTRAALANLFTTRPIA